MNRREFLKRSLLMTAAVMFPMNFENNFVAAKNSLKWWQNTIVYQIYPKSFADTTGSGTGDLNGITAHLDYLKSLNVGAIWLTPIYPSPMVDNGYDISNYTAISPDYGTMADFENLVAEAKAREIRVVMDLVFNHSSDKHAWFVESKSSKKNSKADWYIWRDAKPDGSPPTNWRSIFGGSAWQWCEERGQFYLHTFAVEQPDLNWENPAVRQALYDAANFWIDKGVGGFRIDAITYIKKPKFFSDGTVDGQDGLSKIHPITANTKGILDFLHEFKKKVFDGHDIFTVGEANGVAADELKFWVGRDGVFDMLFEFSHTSIATRGEVWCRKRNWKLTELKGALSASQAATKSNGWYPIFFENHDRPRSVNFYMPNNPDKKSAAKALATILLTLRGTPFIFEGQELGFTNVAWNSIDDYDDIQSHAQYEFALNEGFTPAQALKFVHEMSRDNARTPMQWNASTNAGFTAGKSWLQVNENFREVNAEVEDADADSVLNWYRTLIKLRAENEVLTFGTYEEILPNDEKIFVFARTLGDEKFITAVNFTDEKIILPQEILRGMKILVTTEKFSELSTLAPFEAKVFTKL